MPLSAIAAFGILSIAGHNLLDPIRSSDPLWSILHAPNFVLQTHPARVDLRTDLSLNQR